MAVIGISFSQVSFGQENVRVHRKAFKIKQDGFKEAMKSIRMGNKAYRFGKATYHEARENYLKANKYNDKNAELNYKIGICYLYSDDKFQAIKYLKKAFDLNLKVTTDIHFQLARAYHMSLDFDNAIKEYKLYKQSMPERKLIRLKINIDNYIAECETGKSLISHPVRVIIQNLGKTVNSEYDDYGPVVDSKEEDIYFTSRRPGKINTKRNRLDKAFSEDIYITKKKGKDWAQAQLLSKSLTSKKSEAAVALSPDDKTLYLYKNNRNGNIYFTQFSDGHWKRPKSLGRVNSGDRETSMSITGDGKKNYFVSDRDDNSIGGKDIYVEEKDDKGKWSKPRNLGLPINTPENEEAVNISKDGKTLYFSSKGHPGMGGYDIFMSTLGDNGKWSKPVNMGYPINTPDDDLFFNMMNNGKVAYISGNRDQGFGGMDLYKIIFLGAEKEMFMTMENSPLAFEIYDPKTFFKKPPEYIVSDSSVLLTGKVRDTETKGPVFAKMQIIDSERSSVVATLLTDTAGSFKVRLPQKKAYGVEISAKGYLFYLDVIDFKKEANDLVNKDFLLQGIELGAKVVMKNIFFETGKNTMKQESFQQLNNVIEFMKDNNTLKLEISGHTDNVGSLSANVKLSENRAKSVVDYMIKGGIDKSRLTYKGYGPNQPVAKNNTEAGKAKNRRVEFKITGK
jgi:outer membrane protein OmpA-like peptidoglycan-associated protein/tetratricopeptide (TPR) repeat protein